LLLDVKKRVEDAPKKQGDVERGSEDDNSKIKFWCISNECKVLEDIYIFCRIISS